MTLLYVFRFLMFSCFVQLLLGAHGEGKGYQGDCPTLLECGYLKIQFPFTRAEQPNCGIFAIQNCDEPWLLKTIQLGKQGRRFVVINVSQSFPYSITIRDDDLYQSLQSKNCDGLRDNYTLPISSPLASLQIPYAITMFRCNHTLNVKTLLYLGILNYSCSHYNFYYGTHINWSRSFFTTCSTIQLPAKDLPDAKDPFTFVTADILVEVALTPDCTNCHKKNGLCRLDRNDKFYCVEAGGKGLDLKVKLVSAATGVGVLFFILSCYLARLWKNKSKAHKDFEAFLKSHGPLAVRRYSYSDIKKITKSFKEKLGQGGQGTVFKGKLDDGCQVAMKVLSESKGNGEEFVNEVARISRTSHINIVTLLGYCLEGSKKALIYEFMANGSLEKFIYKTNPFMSNYQLNTEILYQITIGVARGLEYLHRGCNTRIFHFDIKPHNILLDNNFCPKISDFGLAKICFKNESVVSMQGARGTVGYIAPELFNRNFGEVSYKSDVYSYGIMVLEIIGGRKNIEVEVDHTSEIYFPHWIYRRLELNEEFTLQTITNDNDKETVIKMAIVSLWCIQTKPEDRPTMQRVVEMLEGRVETLQIPPKPILSSPPRPPPTYSTH